MPPTYTAGGLALKKPATIDPALIADLNANADLVDAGTARVVNVKGAGYGAAGDGAADDRAALLAAETALGAGGTVHAPAGTYRLASSTTLKPTTHLLLHGGAVLAPAVGTTLTIQGVIRAGPYRIFGGAGTVKLMLPQIVHPEWWGAVADVQTSVAGASITSGQTALTLSWASLTAADVGKAVVVCGAGAAGAPLATTIAAVTGATTATLAAAAATTVANGKAAYGTDSTAALQACLDQFGTAAQHRVIVGGRYGATTLRVYPYICLEGLAQLDFSGFYRLGVGEGGPFLALAAGAASAQGVRIEDLYLDCMQLGTTLGGIELGTDLHARALASGGYLRNVKVKNALGWAFDVRCNVASFWNLWAQHDLALPAGNTTAGGMRFTDTLAYGWQLNVEGPYPAGAFVLGAGGGSLYEGLQMELSGAYATTDVVTVSANQALINGVYATLATHRDLIRIPAGVQDVIVNLILLNSTHTLANVVNDVDRAYTIPGTGLVSSYEKYSSFSTPVDNAAWTSFTPTWTGFSVNPTVTSLYKKEGKKVFWSMRTTANGTSNSTALTATLPVPARGVHVGAGWALGTDNGATVATPVRMDITSTTVVTFFTNPAGGGWTNTGAKAVFFQFMYETA